MAKSMGAAFAGGPELIKSVSLAKHHAVHHSVDENFGGLVNDKFEWSY